MSGGIKVVSIYARRLQAQGHSVVLVSPPLPAPTLRRRLSLLAKGANPFPPLHLSSHLDGSGLDHHVLECWRPVTDADVPDADVVIATWWETAEWVARLGAHKGAKVYFVQGHEVFADLPVARCRATYRLPLHKIVVARWLKDVMRFEYGDANVDVVPNSVDHEQFQAPVRGKQSKPTVGFLYSSSEVKGVDAALSALAIVRRRVPALRVIAFGSERPGPVRPLPADVEFYFDPPQALIPKLYASCDVWLTASRSEGFNLTAMEAMACRTPVVSTRTGWPEEAIGTSYNGMLADVDDVEGLAQCVQKLIDMEDRHWRQISYNAQWTARAGSWDDSAAKFERALMRACNRTDIASNGRADVA